MFSVNFAKFVRTRFMQKTTGTWEIHKRLTKSNIKTTLKMRLKNFSWRFRLFGRNAEHFD